MKICEACGSKNEGAYGSGRFCGAKCARGFSTKANRKQISEMVSLSLRKKSPSFENSNCNYCGNLYQRKLKSQRFCSVSCGSKNSNSRDSRKDHLSKLRIEAISNGKINQKSIRCAYPFRGEVIRCDSKLEFACLDWFHRNYDIKTIRRCEFVLRYMLEGFERRYLPDFVIETTEGNFIVEVKDVSRMESLNKKWYRYNQMIPLKQEALKDFAEKNGLKSFWFTSKTKGSRYRKLSISQHLC